MRDGTKLYGDIYRPMISSESSITKDEKVPAILHWAPYGKESNSERFLNRLPERLGVPRETYSGYEPWEGADPGYWVARGYAVVDVDARGSWNSEGNMYYWGKPDELDGYDTVEWLGKQPWCNGKVGLAGNSWLAISQWFIASARPPSLGAIAPWEGQTDSYRDQARRGGRPDSTMSHGRGILIPGRGLQEDAGRMIETNELWNDYWEDKRAKVGRIECPIYALASYSSKLHGIGTVRGWREAASKEKWLRFHPWFEWYDWPYYQDDLARFFDYYLKGIRNDWLSTPKVRLSLLGFNTIPDVINRPLSTYPPPEMKQKVYYLDALTHTASPERISKEGSISYPAADMKSEVHFDIVFDEYTELAGFAKLAVYMQCFEHNDMDIFVLLQKIDKAGKALRSVNYPNSIPLEDLPMVNVVQYQGPFGNLRASHRLWRARGPSYEEPIPIPNGIGEGEVWEGDRELWHPHMKAERVPPGKIVKVEFTTWPMGSIYRKGEGLRVRISGRDMCFVEASVCEFCFSYNDCAVKC